FSLPAIYHPPITPQLMGSPLGTAFQVCNGAYGATSIFVVALSTIFLARTGELCSDDHAKDFIVLASPYHQTLVLLFVCSNFLLTAAVISITWLNASRAVALFITCAWGLTASTVTLFYANILWRNHKLLKQHVGVVNMQRATFVDRLKSSNGRIKPVCV
ncbi:hypothetical protein DUNSADRAFT_13936, partial [Dunaliella salina]